MNKKIDERQQQEFYKCEHMAFKVMFSLSVIVIIIQLLFMKASFLQVFGETIILLCGGVSIIAACLKSGLWSYNSNEPSVTSNLIYSIICSLIATLLFAIIIYFRSGSKVLTPITIGSFWGGIFIFGFIILTLLSHVSNNRKKKLENKYKDI
jgi:hypothetical protein